MVAGDPDLVLPCVTNLMENAVKYGGGGGWIRISAGRALHGRRAGVEVTIEDRGPGIPDEEAATVFEPFYRGSAAGQSRQQGSGLGLAIVKSAVEALGGSVKLERAVPHGCRFRVFFPALAQTSEINLTEFEEQEDAVPTDPVGGR
jgi:signal transduction histidine kinase